MDFNDYAKGYDSKDLAQQGLKNEFVSIMLAQYLKNDVSFSEGLAGHKFHFYLNDLINHEGNKTNEDIRKRIEYFADKIVTDVVCQSERIDFMRDILSKSTKPASEMTIDLTKIDIQGLLNGNLDWNPRSTYYPDYGCFSCQNDGKKYIAVMDNWKIDFIDREDFIHKKEKVNIRPFLYDNAPVKYEVDFPAGDLLVFNFLPGDIDDFIQEHFSQSQYSFTGRDWNKFLCETLASFNIFRTPTHVGGDILKDESYLILGNYNDEEGNAPIVGSTINTVWQTLVAEKESVIKLIMMAKNMNIDDAEEYMRTEIVLEQDAVSLHIEPGKYNLYYIPEKSEDSDTKSFEKVDMEGSNAVDIDMVITRKNIIPTNKLDERKVVNENEINKAKRIVKDFSLSHNPGFRL